MTGPVVLDDVVDGLATWLLSFPDVLEVLGKFPGTGAPYLFQHELWTVLESTSSTAAVIGRSGSWAGANLHNTLRFPRISLSIYADPIRDAGFNSVGDMGEVYRRIEAAHFAIDARLHRPQSGEQWWGTVRTIACARLTEPTIYSVPDGSGLLRSQCFYAVTQG